MKNFQILFVSQKDIYLASLQGFCKAGLYVPTSGLPSDCWLTWKGLKQMFCLTEFKKVFVLKKEIIL